MLFGVSALYLGQDERTWREPEAQNEIFVVVTAIITTVCFDFAACRTKVHSFNKRTLRSTSLTNFSADACQENQIILCLYGSAEIGFQL